MEAIDRDELTVLSRVVGPIQTSIYVIGCKRTDEAVIIDAGGDINELLAAIDERDAGDAANPELDYEELYPQDILESAKNMEFGATEAPFIFKKNDYYYLFLSRDRCCRGLESSYKIAVGRSKSITGPYLDEAGEKLIHGGGTVIAKENEEWAAVGHQAAYTFNGTDYLIFHGYDKSDDGDAKLIIREIMWEDGWPEISL